MFYITLRIDISPTHPRYCADRLINPPALPHEKSAASVLGTKSSSPVSRWHRFHHTTACLFIKCERCVYFHSEPLPVLRYMYTTSEGLHHRRGTITNIKLCVYYTLQSQPCYTTDTERPGLARQTRTGRPFSGPGQRLPINLR